MANHAINSVGNEIRLNMSEFLCTESTLKDSDCDGRGPAMKVGPIESRTLAVILGGDHRATFVAERHGYNYRTWPGGQYAPAAPEAPYALEPDGAPLN